MKRWCRSFPVVYFSVLMIGKISNGFQIPSSNKITSEKVLSARKHQRNHHVEVVESMNHAASTVFLAASISLASVGFNPLPAIANDLLIDSDVQGISAVTQSKLGQSVRGAVVGGAQLADSLDLKWERFSDSLRDEKKCDPRTNRRMFDNGTRKDGTKIGNPVLGALCTPGPLRALDSDFANVITNLAKEAVADSNPLGMDKVELERKEQQIKEKVAPAFARAAVSASRNAESSAAVNGEEISQEQERQAFNRDLYIKMRAYGDFIPSKQQNYRNFEKLWGRKMLSSLAPNANRNDFTSPFPRPDPTDEQPYDEGSLLDALGGVSVVLSKLQEAGLIGHWEISIPEDDFWEVVTIAVDDDISLGGQILARESRLPLSGSAVVAVVRSAMEDNARISYKMDTFFIDPTTTRQELYNPTQLLVSLSDLGQ